jgi:ankyrin repeat protein
VAVCFLVVAVAAGVRWVYVDEATPLRQPAKNPPAEAALAPAPALAAPEKPKAPAPKVSPWHDGASLTRAKREWKCSEIRELLESGGDPNAVRGPTRQFPLMFGAVYCASSYNFAVPLLEAGADPLARNALGKDVLSHVASGGTTGRAITLRALIPRIRPPQDLSVIDFIRLGDRDRFDRWLAGSPDLEKSWDLGRTPLLWAAYYGRERMAFALIEAGARTDVVDYRDDSPLHFAAMNGNIELARSLLARGLPLDAQNAYGQTPLALSLYAPDTVAMRYLLDEGADPCVGPHGRSDVLHLVDYGAAPNRDPARSLLEPVVASRSCSTSREAATQRNLAEFIAELRRISPPPPSVLADLDDESLLSRDHYWAWIKQNNIAQGSTLDVEEFWRLEEAGRQHGYRALLRNSDDEWFVHHGSALWRPDRSRAALDLTLAIENLRMTRFFHLQNREECLLCDPGEFKWANDIAIAVAGYVERHYRKGQLLIIVDVCEKFIREREHETTSRYIVYKNLVQTLFLLDRTEEAIAVGEAYLDRNYGTSPKRYKNKVGWMVTAIREASEKENAEGAQVSTR